MLWRPAQCACKFEYGPGPDGIDTNDAAHFLRAVQVCAPHMRPTAVESEEACRTENKLIMQVAVAIRKADPDFPLQYRWHFNEARELIVHTPMSSAGRLAMVPFSTKARVAPDGY